MHATMQTTTASEISVSAQSLQSASEIMKHFDQNQENFNPSDNHSTPACEVMAQFESNLENNYDTPRPHTDNRPMHNPVYPEPPQRQGSFPAPGDMINDMPVSGGFQLYNTLRRCDQQLHVNTDTYHTS